MFICAGLSSGLALNSRASQKGTIISEEAYVFSAANFDSEVIAQPKPGEVYTISDTKNGAFYKIRLSNGKMGFISDAEVAPQKQVLKAQKIAKKKYLEDSEKDKDEKDDAPKKFWGPTVQLVQFREDTMGAVRQAQLTCFGWQWQDENSQKEILGFFGVPQYYPDLTQNTATGALLFASYLFDQTYPQSPSLFFNFGFGPFLRLSQYQITLKDDPTVGQSKAYTLQDVAAGGLFRGAVGTGGKRWMLRLEVRYYWELQRYTGFGLNYLWRF